MKKEIKTDQQYIRALIKPNSFDKEKRTFDVTFASETPVRMYNWDIGEFDEILSCDIDNMTPMVALQNILRWKKSLAEK